MSGFLLTASARGGQGRGAQTWHGGERERLLVAEGANDVAVNKDASCMRVLDSARAVAVNKDASCLRVRGGWTYARSSSSARASETSAATTGSPATKNDGQSVILL